MYFLEHSGKAQVRFLFFFFISYIFGVFLKIIITHDLFLTCFRCKSFYDLSGWVWNEVALADGKI